jgi:WXG100 family type VII secretion target
MTDEKIQFQEVRGKAAELRRCNRELTASLQTVRRTIGALEAQWTSDTSDTIRARIDAMQPKFDMYEEVINSYAKFLENTAAQYEAAEKTLQTQASSQFL